MKKILLIEDDTVMRENTAEILELDGHQVTTAPNGKDGCTLAKKILPDLIICDIMMPELDGYGVLHVLSKDPKTSGIPFIFLSAKAEKSDMRKGMELGADDYLTKPFEDTELLKAIEVRFKKLERVRSGIGQSSEGLNNFLDNARGLSELTELSQSRKPVKFKKKHIIFNEGDMPQYLFFLNKGKVKIYKTHDDGKEYVSEVLKEGDFFGITPLFDNKVYSDSAQMLEEGEICKIPKDDFLALIYNNRDVAGQFIKLLSNNVEEKEKQLLSFAYDTVRKRAAGALLQLSKQFKKEGKSETSIRITREDLAGIAGTASETVIRCLGDFKEDKLIEVKGREIIIIDPEGLANIQY